MKKITNDEYTTLIQSRGNEVIAFVLKLGIQESCLIEPSDWTFRTTPPTYFGNRFANKGMAFEVKKLNEEKGWIVKRTA